MLCSISIRSRSRICFLRFVEANMSKKSGKKSKQSEQVHKGSSEKTDESTPISIDKSNNILIQVYAKPGAKINKITGITSEGLNVQISAPPSEGAANTELVKFMANILDLPKSTISLERGHKSRLKVLKVIGHQNISTVTEKIQKEIDEV